LKKGKNLAEKTRPGEDGVGVVAAGADDSVIAAGK